MAEKEEMILEQTKGTFKLMGYVTGIDKDKAYNQAKFKNGKKKGEPYRNLGFGIQTSSTNQVRVSMFGDKPEFVYVSSPKKKKSDDEKQKFETKKVEYDEWKKKYRKWLPQNIGTFETTLRLESEEYEDEETGETKTKMVRERLPRWDAMEYIYDNLDNGDYVTIEGQISYSAPKNEGDKPYVNYNIQSIYKQLDESKHPDMKADDFKEYCEFLQDFIYLGMDVDKSAKKVRVDARIIEYGDRFIDTSFFIDVSEETSTERVIKMGRAFAKKKLKFGDWVKANGVILNKAITKEVEADDSDDDLMAELSGEQSRMNTVKEYISEMQLRGIQELVSKKYTDKDFQKALEKQELFKKESEESSKKSSKKEEKDDDDWMGEDSSISKNEEDEKDPFGTSSQIDISDDDLPF